MFTYIFDEHGIVTNTFFTLQESYYGYVCVCTRLILFYNSYNISQAIDNESSHHYVFEECVPVSVLKLFNKRQNILKNIPFLNFTRNKLELKMSMFLTEATFSMKGMQHRTKIRYSCVLNTKTKKTVKNK